MKEQIAVSLKNRWEHKKVGLLRRINNASVYATMLRAYRDCDPNGPILMAPCSYGWFFPEFRADGIEVVGIDIEKDRIEAANRTVQPPMKTVVGNILQMPFSDNEFDMTISNRFILHFNDEFKAKAMKELARVTRRFLLVHFDYHRSFRLFAKSLRGAKPAGKNYTASSSYRTWKRVGGKLRYSKEMMRKEGELIGLKVRDFYFVSYFVSERVYCLYEKQ